MARFWVEAGTEGRGGLALPPFSAESQAGCFPLFSSPPYSSMPLRERLASMSSCSKEFVPHLSSKQKPIFFTIFFFFFFLRRDCSDIPSGHRLPRQCPLPVPLSTSMWLSLQPPALQLLAEDLPAAVLTPPTAMLNFPLHLLTRCLPPSSVATATQPPEQWGPAGARVCKQLPAGAGVRWCKAAVGWGAGSGGCVH